MALLPLATLSLAQVLLPDLMIQIERMERALLLILAQQRAIMEFLNMPALDDMQAAVDEAVQVMEHAGTTISTGNANPAQLQALATRLKTAAEVLKGIDVAEVVTQAGGGSTDASGATGGGSPASGPGPAP